MNAERLLYEAIERMKVYRVEPYYALAAASYAGGAHLPTFREAYSACEWILNHEVYPKRYLTLTQFFNSLGPDDRWAETMALMEMAADLVA